MPQHRLALDFNHLLEISWASEKQSDAPILWPLENLVASRNRNQLLQLVIALERENTALRGQLRIDPMTKLFNRRALLEELERQWERWVRYDQVASLLLIDLDGFKSINDTYGHPTGDRALITVANHLREHVRGCDWVARIGGDEFAVLLPDSDADEARQVADKLRTVDLSFSVINKSSGSLSELALRYSIGSSTIDQQIGSTQKWLERADLQMYEDKRAIRP